LEGFCIWVSIPLIMVTGKDHLRREALSSLQGE